MAPVNEELKQLLSDVQKFLKQEQELHGDAIVLQSREPAMKKTAPKPESGKVAGDGDLFGTASVEKSTPAPLQQYPQEAWTSAATLDELNKTICTCTKCSLGYSRKKFVFGVGNPKSEIVLIGEAPGADEDEQGEPFVGRAGQLLNKILEAIRFKREEVFICNILKCRPPNNREPAPEEIELCEPYLWKQLELIKPKMILCLGRVAGQALLKTNSSLGNLRGRFHDYRGIKTMVTYHPAALLRNPNWKRPCWEDVQLFRKTYDEMSGS